MTQFVVVSPEPFITTGTNAIQIIDISGFVDPGDYISFALPDFPVQQIDLTQSYVDFSSNLDGDFGAGPTDSIAFSQADPALPLVNGNTEMRIPISLLTTMDKTRLTGIRFRVHAVSACTFRCLAIRACSIDWTYAPSDIDTLHNRFWRPPTPTGALAQGYDFPTTDDSGQPTDFPIIFRSDRVPGDTDPRPIDVKLEAWFGSGSHDAATGSQDFAASFTEGGEVSIADDPDFDFPGAFTLECWINLDDLGNLPMGLITKFNNVNGQKGYHWGITTGGELIFEWSTNGTATTSVTTTGANLQLDTDYGLAVTYTPDTQEAGLPLLLGNQGTTIDFYINGELYQGFGGLPTQTSVFATNRPLKLSAWNTG